MGVGGIEGQQMLKGKISYRGRYDFMDKEKNMSAIGIPPKFRHYIIQRSRVLTGQPEGEEW